MITTINRLGDHAPCDASIVALLGATTFVDQLARLAAGEPRNV